MIWLLYVVAFAYVVALFWLYIGAKKLSLFLRKDLAPTTHFSVVIVFRNEAENLPLLLQSIQQLAYPSEAYELLLVDDASNDGSSEVIHTFFKHQPHINYRVFENIQTTSSPKKDAITLAISKANYQWIVTTDADCQVPTQWLQCLNDFIQTEYPICIAGPVIFKNNGTFLQEFQHYDGLSLQVVAQGSFGQDVPMVCNGAHFSYTKEAFYSVNGFEGNSHLASGDDVFLLEKLQENYPQEVRFLSSSEAIVTTFPVKTWTALVQQRMRWASKSSEQQHTGMKVLGSIVVLFNLVIVLSFFTSLSTLSPWFLFWTLMGIKFLIDFVVLFSLRTFYDSRFRLITYLASALLYPWFIVFVLVKSMASEVMWKDRPIKKQA